MRLAFLCFLLVFCVACDQPAEPPVRGSHDAVALSLAATEGGGDRVKVTVIFHGEPPMAAVEEELLENVGAEFTYRFNFLRAASVMLPEQALAELSRNPRVFTVSRGAPVHPFGDAIGWEKIPVFKGNNFEGVSSSTGDGVRVVVAGWGVQCDNPDLICAGGETFARDSAPWYEDGFSGNGHETAVASLIFAQANGFGRLGWARDGELWSGRIFADQGETTCNESAEMLDWASSIDADVVNMSYGGKVTEETEDPNSPFNCLAEKFAAGDAAQMGALLVAAAGNRAQVGDSVAQPAYWSSVMAVGGMECGSDNGVNCDHSAGWWNGASFGSQLDIVAAAHNVLVLEKGSFATWLGTGTSFAAPLVSAAGALVIQKWNCWESPVQVKGHLRDTAYGPDSNKLGDGKLEVGAALGTDPGNCFGIIG